MQAIAACFHAKKKKKGSGEFATNIHDLAVGDRGPAQKKKRRKTKKKKTEKEMHGAGHGAGFP